MTRTDVNSVRRRRSAWTDIVSRRYGHLGPNGKRTYLRWLAVLLAVAAVAGGGWDVSQSAYGDHHGEAAAESGSHEDHDHADESHGDDHATDSHGDGHGGDHGHGGGGHADPVAPVLLAIVIILLAAKIGGSFFERIGMPAVLGELTLGIIIGNWAFLTGSDTFVFMHPPADFLAAPATDVGATIKLFAGVGVILLLFEVGLESTIREMLSVGVSALLVAILGVVAPIGLGYATCYYVFGLEWQVAAFIGATLCATSVGITARVLKDIGRSQDRESQIILGAAVVDDVLGLIVLAVVSGIITASAAAGTDGAEADLLTDVGLIVAYAFGFLGVALALGAIGFPKVLFNLANLLKGSGLLVATALVICFGLSFLANFVGLAPIVGAFAAGLILEDAQYRDLEKRENVQLEEAIRPLTALLVPIFFVEMGMEVNLASFGDFNVLLLGGAITVIAFIGKQVCSFGVIEPGLNKLAVGLGMVPRGEVGLIFASVGRELKVNGHRVVDDGIYSAVVVMVMITTMVTPPLLKWAMTKDGTDTPGEAAPPPDGLDDA
ncbi:MAG: cation:proton antiporter [Planctomycetota bacterium]